MLNSRGDRTAPAGVDCPNRTETTEKQYTPPHATWIVALKENSQEELSFSYSDSTVIVPEAPQATNLQLQGKFFHFTEVIIQGN